MERRRLPRREVPEATSPGVSYPLVFPTNPPSEPYLPPVKRCLPERECLPVTIRRRRGTGPGRWTRKDSRVESQRRSRVAEGRRGGVWSGETGLRRVRDKRSDRGSGRTPTEEGGIVGTRRYRGDKPCSGNTPGVLHPSRDESPGRKPAVDVYTDFE